MNDSRSRSVVKAICWRLTGSLATFVIAWAVGGKLGVASTIAVIQMVANTLLYYLHERVWDGIAWGKQ